MKALTRIGLNLIIVGIMILSITMLLFREEISSIGRLQLHPRQTSFQSFYLMPSNIEFIIEVKPSNSKINLILLDEKNMISFLEHKEFNALKEYTNMSGVNFDLKPSRGIHCFYIENLSNFTSELSIRRIIAGMPEDATAASLTFCTSGAILILYDFITKRYKPPRNKL